jgi:hypothetical protein
MYPNLQDPDSESSSDAENIPPFQKHRKLLSGATYHKQLVDENGQPLHPANWNMASSSHNPGSTMVIIVWYNVISTNQLHCAY